MPIEPDQIDWVALEGIEGCLLAVAVEGSPASPLILDSGCDSTGYLGALLDPYGSPFEFVEIRIQETQHLLSVAELGETITNPQLEARWQANLSFGAKADTARIYFRGPWEHEHPAPSFFEPSSGRMAKPEEGWRLCMDDELLNSKRLAPFGESPHRYLVDAGRSRFVPLNDAAPRSPDTLEFEEVFKGLVPINREGGLMYVRRLPQFAFSGFADFISGKSFVEEPDSLLRCPVVDPASQALLKSTGPANSGFLHSKGEPADRFAEVLFLKLSLLLDAFRRVSECVAANQTAMLGLTSESFAVHLAKPSGSLPSFWNSRVELISTPSVARIALPNSDEFLMAPCEQLPRSIYRTEHATSITRGVARARIRRVSPPDDLGLSIIEGTLETDELVNPSRKDLLQFDIRLTGGRRLTLLANALGSAGAENELRFLSLPVAIPEELATQSAKGGPQIVERIEFRVLPRLGTAHDLFSLGVIATRVLLHNGRVGLSESLDDLFRLSAAYSATLGGANWETGAGHLSDFIASERGREWRHKLGPSCLIFGTEPNDSMTYLPARHWWKVVEFVGKLFPGRMPGAFCNDLDDFDSRFLQRVFEAPIQALESLLDHTRSLLFDNPSTSREILDVIRNFSMKQRP